VNLLVLNTGADKVKEALAARKLKCGGTPLQRAQRLFQCREKLLSELPADLFQKGCAPVVSLDAKAREKRLKVAKQTAKVEQKVLLSLLLRFLLEFELPLSLPSIA
jgi:hypothetical protein